MKAKFVINERPSINTFLYVLKILYSNSPEVLFHFHKTGISLSQSWQDKDPERGKYFFFLQDTHFSKILCNEENIFLRFNIKEILQKLRSAKKEVKFQTFSLITIFKDYGAIHINKQ